MYACKYMCIYVNINIRLGSLYVKFDILKGDVSTKMRFLNMEYIHTQIRHQISILLCRVTNISICIAGKFN